MDIILRSFLAHHTFALKELGGYKIEVYYKSFNRVLAIIKESKSIDQMRERLQESHRKAIVTAETAFRWDIFKNRKKYYLLPYNFALEIVNTQYKYYTAA